MRKLIDRMIAALFLMMALLLGIMADWRTCWYWIVLAVLLAGMHIWWSVREGQGESKRENIAVDEGMASEGALTGGYAFRRG